MGNRKNCLVREGHVCGGQVTRASLQGFLRASVHVSLGNRAMLSRMVRKLGSAQVDERGKYNSKQASVHISL